MRTLTLPSGKTVPVLGQGTWGMGEDRRRRAAEAAALALGLDLGMTLIDTAEMYGDGGAEEVVGEAMARRRAEVFLVSKFYPQNATRQGVAAACGRSLRRLKTDFLDLYLYHWRGSVPLPETVEALEGLRESGKIRDWGVSNFDTADMEELVAVAGGAAVATNQVLYNLSRRGIEWDLLPWCRKRGIPLMAYSPVEQGRILSNPALGSRPAQMALAWLLRQPDVMVIPKAATAEHVRDNRAALDVELTGGDLKRLDRAFPPPTRKRPLAML
jgi:diketogulonate reductase-like aldo/keto reductase